MKSSFFLCLLLAAATTTHAQNNFLGIKGGFTATSAHVDFYNGGVTGSRNGFAAGITYEHLFKSGLSLSADLLYSQRGYKTSFSYDGLPTNNGAARKPGFISNVLNTYNYLTLPLRGGFNFGNTFYGFVNAGLVPALILHSEAPYFVYDINGPLVQQGTRDVTDKRNLFDLALIAEAGGGYCFSNESRAFIAASYQQSTPDAAAGLEYGTVHHNGLTVALGFKWSLSQ